MNIKTWHERAMLIDVNNRQITPVYMQAEIDELRAALVERDAEIERLKTVPMKYRRMAFNAELQEEVAAQRKLLEQALEALSYLKVEIIDGWDARNQQHLRDKAITAIQEVL
jgi:hypothetical protein